jgi:outer membrane protein assembly factor BamD
MPYILAKRGSLLIAALGISMFALPGLGAQTQGSSGQSGQSGQGSQSGQSGQTDQSGAAQPGVAHSSDSGQPATTQTSKASNDKKTNSKKPSVKKTSDKKSKKDKKAAKNTKTAKNVKPSKPTNAKSKKGGDKDNEESKEASAEPDKVLYDRAMGDIKKSRYTEGRLSLQTLINTYPDSEYLAKAKLAVADSYFKEGGTTNLTQSIQEYIDFQTFFPFLDEAAYAQMQVGMAHYKMMEKSDRDSSQAQGAEDAFQTFLLKYPANPLIPQAEQRLRDVQELLADGEFKIGRFYYVKQDYRAAAARLIEVTDRYPLYSGSDQALWMLGDVYTRAKQVSKNEDDKNHWADLAGKCYTRIARDYPMSKYSGDAKARLSSMGMPVPTADPAAVARMQKEQLYAKAHHESIIKKAPLSMIKSNPDLSTAAHIGAPNLNPPTDTVSATDVLKSGAAGPTFGIAASSSAGGSAESGGEVTSGDTTGAAPAPSGPGMFTGAQIISTGGAPASNAAPPTAPPSQPSMEGGVLNPSGSTSPSNPPAGTAPAGTTEAPAGSNPAPSNAPAANPPAGNPPAQAGANGSPAPAASGSAPAASSDPKQESSSKKKKGLRKLIPF